jgi:hypothetical protein
MSVPWPCVGAWLPRAQHERQCWTPSPAAATPAGPGCIRAARP